MNPFHDEDFFQELADGAPVMIWMSGLDGGCFYFNRAWLNFRGRTLEQEAGNGWVEGVHPDDVERCVRYYLGCFEQRLAFAMSYRLRDHRGEYRWILDRGAPHFFPNGTFLGFYGGCAETESDATLGRSGELRASLAEMRAFAQQRAMEEAALLSVFQGGLEATASQLFTRERHSEHVERVRGKQYAAVQLGRLAADMLRYGTIRRGECLQ